MDQPNLAFQKRSTFSSPDVGLQSLASLPTIQSPFHPLRPHWLEGATVSPKPRAAGGGGGNDVRLELPTNGVSLNQREVPAPHWNTPNLNQRLTTKLDESGWRQRAMRKAFVLSALRLPLLVRSHWLLVLHSTESIATCFSAPLRSMWPSFRVNCTTIQQLRKRGEKRRKEIEREEISGCMFQN